MSDQKLRNAHKGVFERTNRGHYFSDCKCGANLGVYPDRAAAKLAHALHVRGAEVPDDE